MSYNKTMKRFLILFFILISASGVSLAYSIKIFDRAGHQIGSAHKAGEDYEIYDMSGKRVTDYDSFYSSIDTPATARKTDIYPAKPGQKWVGVGAGVNLKTVRDSKGQKFRVVRSNPYYTNSVNIKVYDRTGKFIGYAKTDGTTDYMIYDRNGKLLDIDIPLYSPPGKPLGSYWERYRGQTPY